MIVALIVTNAVWAAVLVWIVHTLKPKTIVVEQGDRVVEASLDREMGKVTYMDEHRESMLAPEIKVSYDDAE